MKIILGIDPGSRITGYGLIKLHNNKAQYLGSGCIRVEDKALPNRLHHVFTGVSEIISQYQPNEFAIEHVFMSKNADSALKLGQARGAAIVAATSQDIGVYEYSAKQIKQSVVGKGNATKVQVQHMVQHLMHLNKKPQADAADALAVALCHFHTEQSLVRLSGQASKTVRGRLQ